MSYHTPVAIPTLANLSCWLNYHHVNTIVHHLTAKTLENFDQAKNIKTYIFALVNFIHTAVKEKLVYEHQIILTDVSCLIIKQVEKYLQFFLFRIKYITLVYFKFHFVHVNYKPY